ncbi:MAG TPA: hypothetical protein VIM56_02025 [Rhizomicrobium sp.]
MDFQHMVNATWDFFREGFNQVNALEGLIIALVAALFVPAWHRVWAVALGATLVTIILNVLLPVLADHAAFRLPPLMEPNFWRFAAALFVGYLVVIGVFFFLKRIFLREAH